MRGAPRRPRDSVWVRAPVPDGDVVVAPLRPRQNSGCRQAGLVIPGRDAVHALGACSDTALCQRAPACPPGANPRLTVFATAPREAALANRAAAIRGPAGIHACGGRGALGGLLGGGRVGQWIGHEPSFHAGGRALGAGRHCDSLRCGRVAAHGAEPTQWTSGF